MDHSSNKEVVKKISVKMFLLALEGYEHYLG